jgi:serine/threonine protein kinase
MTIQDRVGINRPRGECPTVALVMPLFEAGDLHSLALRAGGESRPPLGLSATLAPLCNLLCGLSHMHANGLVHGDLKPANILLAGGCGDGFAAVISDFGMTSEQGSWQRVPGTTAYNAPEVRSIDQPVV